ncbi:MAG: cobalamin biosynthesis protein CbiG, partial [Alphaproteobacteria bacterium]|nr:cobalamin biosynthesis protein CbiG [Alphaproteobacteria bacterium]
MSIPTRMPRAEPRFDAVVTVDWSAAAKPTTGADSIWLAAVGRDGWAGLVNPPTRGAAMATLRHWLARCLERRQRVLVACDFPLGFPRGTAQALGLTGGEGAWLALWRRLARDLVDDDATNHNNRFAVASAWNAALGPAFWGCPPAAAGTHLNPRKPAHRPLPDRRLVEERMPTAQSVWKLYTTGSVGSQALTGMARLLALKDYFGNNLSVWPFETSWSAGTTPVVVAEMYPSLHPAEVLPGLPRDAGQAVAMARWLIDADPAVFQGEPGLQPAEDAAVRREEGWVLGVSGPQTAVRSA